jgi:hypothetical protein
MDFKRISKYFLKSDCGNYSVSRTPDVHGKTEYNAWRELAHIGGPFTNSHDAKDACIKHRSDRHA